MRNTDGHLFWEGDLSATLTNITRKLADDIERRPEHYVLNVNEEEFIKHLVAEYHITPLDLLTDQLNITSQGETETEISDFGRRLRVKRPFIALELPFSGDAFLFKLRPDQHDLNPPKAQVSGQTVSWRIVTDPNTPPERLKSEIDAQVASIQSYCRFQRPTLDAWNQRLEEQIRSTFKARKDRLLKNASLVSALGIPMNKRADPSGTYAVPVSTNRIVTAAPKVDATKYEPHPTLTESDYQEILRHLRHMSHTIERMPDAFRSLGEEEIRTQFLMHLNGVYEGNATGETFSHNGKTDIFLKAKDRAVFIAECKFWSGAAGFSSIIDQLLGYLTWRETKTAILLFVRNQDVARVCGQIADLVRQHRSFTRFEQQSTSSSEFRFIMKSDRDESLPLILTVLVFHLPQASTRVTTAKETR